jgi:hypothetical protein
MMLIDHSTLMNELDVQVNNLMDISGPVAAAIQIISRTGASGDLKRSIDETVSYKIGATNKNVPGDERPGTLTSVSHLELVRDSEEKQEEADETQWIALARKKQALLKEEQTYGTSTLDAVNVNLRNMIPDQSTSTGDTYDLDAAISKMGVATTATPRKYAEAKPRLKKNANVTPSCSCSLQGPYTLTGP